MPTMGQHFGGSVAVFQPCGGRGVSRATGLPLSFCVPGMDSFINTGPKSRKDAETVVITKGARAEQDTGMADDSQAARGEKEGGIRLLGRR